MKKPNILLIFTDQHRLSAVGCYGETPCKTPNIDRLAAEGVRFENAYTTCPLCSPARATIMTGYYPHRHGVTENVHATTCVVNELPDTPNMLSRRLETAGYRNGYSGKWHLGGNLTEHMASKTPVTPSLPKDLGFEGQNFPGHGGGGFNYPEYKQYLEEKGFTAERTTWQSDYPNYGGSGVTMGPTESTVPYFLTQHTIDLISDFQSRDDGKPFFLWHNFWGPHGPYVASEEFFAPYRDLPIPPWPNYHWDSKSIAGPHQTKVQFESLNQPWESWELQLRHYYAFTTLIDAQIGRMIDHLEAIGELENTIIIFTADHGETCGSHGGLRDKGFHHFDEIHRIPMIVRFPNKQWAGQVRDELVSLADIYPTILDVADSAMPEDLHGCSLLSLIENRNTQWRDAVVSEFHGLNGTALTLRTLRKGDLKYGYTPFMTDELYDLSVDPHETRNLINNPDYADAVNDMRKSLFAWMEDTGDQAANIFRMTGRCKGWQEA